jgi:predicted nicotinamide N-methyase
MVSLNKLFKRIPEEILSLDLDQELSQRFDSLYQWLNRKYILELIEQPIGGHSYKIYKIFDIDQMLDKIAEESNADEHIPYWTELWPSSIALGEFIQTQKIKGMNVLGIGSGVAATEMVARKLGAKVVLSDNQEDALRIAELNWIMNFNESPQILQLDWRHPEISRQFEILLASDVAYEQRLFWPLIDTFQKLLSPSGVIFLSEPNRTIARDFFELLEKKGFELEGHNQRIFYKSRDTDISVYRIWANKN